MCYVHWVHHFLSGLKVQLGQSMGKLSICEGSALVLQDELYLFTALCQERHHTLSSSLMGLSAFSCMQSHTGLTFLLSRVALYMPLECSSSTVTFKMTSHTCHASAAFDDHRLESIWQDVGFSARVTNMSWRPVFNQIIVYRLHNT